MKTKIMVIILVMVTGISLGQVKKMSTFENSEKCKVLEIRNISGSFDTIIEHGGIYIESKEGIIFANICYKNNGVIYGNPKNYYLNQGKLTLEIPRKKIWNPTGSIDPIIVVLQLSKKDLVLFNTFIIKSK